MRCKHEVIVAVCDDSLQEQSEGDILEEDCAHCHKRFELRNGGKCMDCKSLVFYCSKKCQVCLL